METSISNEIIKVLDALCDKFGIAVDWSSENVLPYVNELTDKFIAWQINKDIFLIILGVIFCALCIPLFKIGKWSWAKVHEVDIYVDDGWIALSVCAYVFMGLSLITGAILIPTTIWDLIKCLSFPELTILEYIQNLLN